MMNEEDLKKGIKQMLHITNNIMHSMQQHERLLKDMDNITSDKKFREGLEDGQLMKDDGVVDKDVRRSKIRFIHDSQIRMAICDYVNTINADTLGLDMYPFQAELQYAEYTAEDRGYFDWHADTNPFKIDTHNPELVLAKQRKWSASLLLNSQGEDYEGGEFECLGYNINPKEYKRGSFILFPSLIQHRVKPVTKGVRKVLVCFFHGPRWR